MKFELHTTSLGGHDQQFRDTILYYGAPLEVSIHDSLESRREFFDGLGLVGLERVLPKVLATDETGSSILADHGAVIRMLIKIRDDQKSV